MTAGGLDNIYGQYGGYAFGLAPNSDINPLGTNNGVWWYTTDITGNGGHGSTIPAGLGGGGSMGANGALNQASYVGTAGGNGGFGGGGGVGVGPTSVQETEESAAAVLVTAAVYALAAMAVPA